MGWLVDFVTDWFWIEFVERMSRGKPWWVWALWALSPLIAVVLIFGALWIALE